MKTSITVVEKLGAEAPASISVLDGLAVRAIPGVNLDDRLRMIPGFSLFRRSSSQVAHPTAQGISLRGLGSSGASRTLVLWDGVPVNDPFGGWIYWTRLAPEEVGRVEVSRGASTSVFGDRALGGAIGLFTREPERHRLEGSYEGGNRNTHSLGAAYSHVWRRAAISGRGRGFTTNGYFIVPETVRGAIDTNAGVRFASGDVRLDFFGAKDRLFVRSDLLVEDRENGTTLQRNSTSLGSVAAQYFRDLGSNSLSVTGYHVREEFRSSFSSIGAGRRTESLFAIQSVPAESVGGAGIFRHSGAAWNGIAGADIVRVEGFSFDTFFPAGRTVGGGTMLQHGYFLQGDAGVGPARFFGGARHSFTGQDRQFFSPSGGFAVGKGRWRGRGSAYRSFRAPTLNELFRDFRAGTAITRANDRLTPEKLFGAEAGVDFSGEAVRAGATVFRNSMEDVITNVTLSTTGGQTIRQRQNAAEALARGFELDVRHRWRHFSTEASYLFVDTRFNGVFRTPQVAKHQGSAQVTYIGDDTLASFGVRAFSLQFEDDRNTPAALLPGFATVHASLRQRIAYGLSATLAIENLLNKEYRVAFATIPSIGPPRLWRAGLRWEGKLRP